MPFGLPHALATFNRMMILRPHRVFVDTFIDNMIIFSKTETKHEEHLSMVFEEFWGNHLVVNGKKSESFKEKIHFLGAYRFKGWHSHGSN